MTDEFTALGLPLGGAAFLAVDFTALGFPLGGAAFLAVDTGFAGFPEVFRLGEVLVIFFNGARLEPVAQGRKDR